MGTRSLTHVFEKSEDKLTEILCIYRQYDGYPSGVGKDYAEFLNGFEIVNGFGLDRDKLANGAGCLAAQLIKNIKKGVGNVYIYPIASEGCGEDYTYEIIIEVGKQPIIRIFEYERKLIFEGAAKDLLSKVEEL